MPPVVFLPVTIPLKGERPNPTADKEKQALIGFVYLPMVAGRPGWRRALGIQPRNSSFAPAGVLHVLWFSRLIGGGIRLRRWI